MPIETKKNHNNENISTNNLDNWYGLFQPNTPINRMLTITISLIIIIFGLYKFYITLL